MPATPARKKVAAPAPKKARNSTPQGHMVAMKANLPARTGKTYKVALASKKDVDAEALGYLKQAYELDGRAKA